MELDYKAIGLRIRNERIRIKMSQERLAELADLSVTHTSHIETGNTKLSLPALVRIANALGVSLDSLVCDSLYRARHTFENEITRSLKDCDEQELRVIADTVKTLKESLKRRFRKP